MFLLIRVFSPKPYPVPDIGLSGALRLLPVLGRTTVGSDRSFLPEVRKTKALLIILAVLAFFVLIAFIRPTVRIRTGNELSVALKVLFFRFRLFPRKEKKIKLKNFKIKNFRKMRLKEEKRLLAKQKKKAEKEQKKAEKAQKKEAKGEVQKEESEGKRSLRENTVFVLDLVKYVLARALSKFGKYLRIEIRQIDITVAGEDPAKTAITFGTVVQAVSYIKELADQTLNVRYPEKREQYIAVRVDYLSAEPTVLLDISFGIRIWQIIAVGIAALKGYFFDVGKHEEKKTGKEQDEPGSALKNGETEKKTKKSDRKKEPVKTGTEV